MDRNQNPHQDALPWPQGCNGLPRSHGHHVTITQPCATHATSSADLGPEGPNPLFFQSISILLHANASLIAPQWSYAYLFSFPTWRPIICTPVPCLHPHLFHPHADSRPSYRYSLASVLIEYMSLQPCGSILYQSPFGTQILVEGMKTLVGFRPPE